MAPRDTTGKPVKSSLAKADKLKTESDRLEYLASALSKAVPGFRDSQHMALAAYRQLAEGAPASVEDIAERAGASVERVEELLRTWPGVFFDRHQRLIGFWGLTVRRLSPTHRIMAGERELFAWCAWDTLFLPGILETSLSVESRCPVTGDTISLTVTPEQIIETSHPGAWVSFLVPDHAFDADVVQSFCHFVHFFASPGAAETWIAEHPGTFALTLEDAFELGRLVNDRNFPSLAARQ
jgi:alkylmercury lyase